jgi:hypothetical protein
MNLSRNPLVKYKFSANPEKAKNKTKRTTANENI